MKAYRLGAQELPWGPVLLETLDPEAMLVFCRLP